MKFTVSVGRAAGVLLLIALLGVNGTEAKASLLPPNGLLFPAPAQADTGGTVLATESVGFVASTFTGKKKDQNKK